MPPERLGIQTRRSPGRRLSKNFSALINFCDFETRASGSGRSEDVARRSEGRASSLVKCEGNGVVTRGEILSAAGWNKGKMCRGKLLLDAVTISLEHVRPEQESAVLPKFETFGGLVAGSDCT